MAASPSSVHWSASSRASSLASLGSITDEREFDNLPSMIPDSQQHHTTMNPNPSPKKFSAIQEDITESVLSEGFRWPVKQPPRPGQFSGRPNHKPTQAPVFSPYFRQPPIVPREIQPRLSLGANTSSVHRPYSPLDLPEIGLFKNHAPAKYSSVGPDTSQTLPTTEEPNLQEHSAEDDCLQLPIPSVGSIAPGYGKSQSPSDQVSAHEKDDTETDHQQPPILNKSTLSQIPINNQLVDCSKSDKPVRTAGWDLQDLNQLKIPLPRENRVHQPFRDDSPSSLCGDLEQPVPQTTRSQHHRDRGANGEMPSHPIQTPHQQENHPEDRERPHSRTSNISKRRSTVQEHRTKSAPERKREAMQQVAQYWNECMKISEDERQEATWEIERLHTQINHREEELNVASGLLTEKEIEVTETQKRCQELERHGLQATDEIKSLNNQLEKFQGHADGMRERCRTYRLKLNEAIAEQQALFVQSRQYYEATKKELEDEKAARVADSLKISDKIETAHKAHEEMKIRLDEVRTQAERDRHNKERIVSELEGKLKQQTIELVHERDSATEIRQWIEDQTKIQDSITRVESQVQSLLEGGTYPDACGRNQRESTDQLSSKLDPLIEHLELLKNNTAANLAVEPVVEGLEKMIVSKVLPAISTIISEQRQSNEEFKYDLLAQLEEFETGFARQEHFDLLAKIATQTSNSEMTYRKAAHQFAEWTHCQQKLQKDVASSLENKMIQQFRRQEFTATALKQQLQLEIRGLGSKVDAKHVLVLHRVDERKKDLQNAIYLIQNIIDRFEETNARADKERAQSQRFQAALETHLMEVEEKLARSSLGDVDSAALRQALNEEQKTTTNLRQQLAQREREAKISKDLHERWRKNTEAINAMRVQIKDMTGRLPRVEDLEDLKARLQHMIQSNQTMNSAESYLDIEGLWIDQRLGKQVDSEILGDDIAEKSQGPQKENRWDGGITASPSRQSMTKNPPSILTDLCDPTGRFSSREEHLGRKVVVNSPRNGINSPLPPPSIEQEQLRRRETAAPRSILRTLASSAQGSTQDSEFPRLPLHRDKYNRPVIGKPSSTADSANQKWVDQIRAQFVPPTQKSHYNFPTVADSERDATCFRDGKDATAKKRLSDSFEQDQGPSTKKMKATDVASRTSTQTLKNHGSQGKETKRGPVLWTYSRKQNSENESWSKQRASVQGERRYY